MGTTRLVRCDTFDQLSAADYATLKQRALDRESTNPTEVSVTYDDQARTVVVESTTTHEVV